MHLRAQNCLLCLLILAPFFLFPGHAFAQRAGATPSTGGSGLKVFVEEAGGIPVDELALVILTNMEGMNVQQGRTRGGYAEFRGLEGGSYKVQVIAASYDPAAEQVELDGRGVGIVTVTLKPASHVSQSTAAPGPPILAPKAKKELGKALEAMHASKLAEARNHLDAAYRLAPGNPEVNYIFGVYSIEANELAKAKDHLEKVLNFYPKHGGALRSLGIVFLQENKPPDAQPYLERAAEANLHPGLHTPYSQRRARAKVWLKSRSRKPNAPWS